MKRVLLAAAFCSLLSPAVQSATPVGVAPTAPVSASVPAAPVAAHKGLEIIDGKPFFDGQPVRKVPKGAPIVEQRSGRYFIGDKEVQMKGDVPWLNGRPLKTFTIIRSDPFRVDLPGPAARRLMLHVPPSQIGADLVLPRLFVFDAATGQSVHAAKLPAPLAKLFREKQFQSSLVTLKPAGGLRPLDMALKDAIAADGSTPTAAFPGAQFVIVQWWAGWCHPCLQEGREFSAVFAKSPLPAVKWITVEKDPMKKEPVANTSAKEAGL